MPRLSASSPSMPSSTGSPGASAGDLSAGDRLPPIASLPAIDRLRAIMAALRTPGTGCPWDLEQTAVSIAPYAIEEAYEVVDAIERGDADDLRDELGDLLLQVVFHARLAEEAGTFVFEDVASAICAKMIRRHPHVFGSIGPGSVSAVQANWESIKAQERQDKRDRTAKLDGALERDGVVERGSTGARERVGLLADVPTTLPGLTRAVKLQTKAAKVGFDWGSVGPVLAKIREEIDEIEEALAGRDAEAVAGEIGDLLFAVANLARHAGADPETAVRATNAKFERRFAFIEAALEARGRSPDQSSLEEMDALWDEAKGQGL